MIMIPNNLKTESAVLGAILINPDNAYTAIENLTAESFYSTRHQLLFQSMHELFKNGVNIDFITLNDHLKRQNKLEASGGMSYITELADSVPVSYSVIDYCNILKRTQYEREVFYLVEKYKEGKIEFEELTAKIMDLPMIRQTDEQTLKDLFLSTLKKSSQGVKYKFLLPTLNKYFGGVDDGEIVVIGGHTSQGKSMFGLQLATDFAEQGLKVLYCTSEMSPEESARRILSRQTEINITDFRRGNLEDYLKKKIEVAGKTLGDTWKIIIRYTIYTSEIRNCIRKYDPDIIFVDHLQNMDRKERGLNDYQRVTYNMRDIQVMSIQTRKPFFILSQFNRSNKESVREPRLSDLRDSGAIEEKANICLFLYWKDQLLGKVKPRYGGEPPEDMKLIIAKNRDGVLGKFQINFYPEYCKIETPEWHDEELMEEANQMIRERL